MSVNVVVFGSNSDIAKTFIDLAQQNGWNIFTVSRGNGSNYTINDIANFDEVQNAMQNATEKLGQIDGVVNFCGSVLLRPAHLTSFEDYIQTINSSLTTSFAVTRAVAKFAKQNCSVVFIGSAAANIGLANHEAIAAAKGGVIALAKSAAATYCAKNIRFNVVNPGLVETRLTAKITQNADSLKYSLALKGLDRIGNTLDIANMVLFLLNPQNNWITGSCFDVDGGLSTLKIKK